MLPNFLIIGTGKAGTTSLYEYLKEHPDVYMSPEKETNFFSFEGGRPVFTGPGDDTTPANINPIVDIGRYQELFAGVNGETAIGEASPSYIYVEKAPERIKSHIPAAKLVAILRDPADRAYSNYAMLSIAGRDPVSDFSSAIDQEEQRIKDNWAPTWHHVRQGFYHQQLSRYFALFDRSQIKVFLYEDLRKNASGTIRELYRFLEVDENFKPDMDKKHNVTGVPQNAVISKVFASPVAVQIRKMIKSDALVNSVKKIRDRNIKSFPPLSSVDRARLISLYREDTLKLQELIGRDLTLWLE